MQQSTLWCQITDEPTPLSAWSSFKTAVNFADFILLQQHKKVSCRGEKDKTSLMYMFVGVKIYLSDKVDG